MKGHATSAATLLRSVLARNRFGSTSLPQSQARLQSGMDESPLLAFVEQHAGECIVVVAFLAVSMTLFVMGAGIPYVMDNNETFSSLNHAHNLWNFDFFRSYGLADEAASPDAAAHPVVHSHQGNFPRLFAFLIYVLGARSAESQILVTTLTIGVASVLMAYTFFRRLAGELFATVTLLVFVTDYLMFAQWQVNTYRVWHGFFLFGTLLCVHGYAEWRRRNWLLATFLLYVGLFYWELVFAVFTALTAGFYSIWVYRHRWSAIVTSGLVQAAGALCGLAIIITQLAFYLGWDGFVEDLTLTLTARNYAPDDQNFLQILRDFYESRNIAFFYNVQSAENFLGPISFLRSLFSNVVQVQSPVVSLLALTLAAAVLLADSQLPGPQDIRCVYTAPRLASIGCLTLGIFMLLLSLNGDGLAVLGASWSGLQGRFTEVLFWGGPVLGVIAVALAVLLFRGAERFSAFAPPRLGRSIRAAFFLGLLGIYVADQGLFFNRLEAPLWLDYLTPVSSWTATALVLATAALGGFIILIGRRTMLGRWHFVPGAIAPFVICGALAYATVYQLSAGYLHTGYLYRLCPLPVFVYDVMLALGVFSALAIALTLVDQPLWQSRPALPRLATAALAAVLGCTLVVLWGSVQLRYMSLVPPNQFSFVEELGSDSIRGRGILSNTYATPFGVAAGGWAYLRSPNGKGGSVPSDAKVAADNPYIWLADRSTNTKYLRPDYYVCFFQLATTGTLRDAIVDENADRCSQLDIVRRAIYGPTKGFDPEPEIIARDRASDRWAILRLKWAEISPNP
jgi:hypothetical protein